MFSLTCSELFGLLQMGDSAFPIGGFSFSAGLEGAVAEGMVASVDDLEQYTHATLWNAARADAIAALEAYRAIGKSRLELLPTIEARLMELKLPPEARTATLRMGSRLAALVRQTSPSPLVARWGEMVDSGALHPSLPIAQAIAAALSDVGEAGLFALHLYGTASMVLGASLRLMRGVSHVATQRIFGSLAPLVGQLYELYGSATTDQMSGFAPLLDVAASLHERGTSRLFMN